MSASASYTVSALTIGTSSCRAVSSRDARSAVRRAVNECRKSVPEFACTLNYFVGAFTLEYDHPRVVATIEDWPVDVVADYARLVELLTNHGPAIGMPHSRALGQGLFELRPRGHSGTGRALYCFVQDRRIAIVHALLKKTRATPGRDLAIARQRTKEIQRG